MCLSLAARVIEVDAARHEATVELDGARRTVSLAVLTLDGRDVPPGVWVLVHTGFAVDLLDEAEAAEILALHRALHHPPTAHPATEEA